MSRQGKQLTMSFVLFLMTIFLWSFQTHNYHVSVTKLQYNEEIGRFEVKIKLFSDDIVSGLRKEYHSNIDIDANDPAKFNDYLFAYIQEHCIILADGRPLELNLLGVQANPDEVEVYLETNDLIAPNALEINNTILFDVVHDQKNICHWLQNGKKITNYTLEDKPSITMTYK